MYLWTSEACAVGWRLTYNINCYAVMASCFGDGGEGNCANKRPHRFLVPGI